MLKAPFPYFGGKRHVASLVWQRLGKLGTYIEPFAGSLAVLLACPHPAPREYVTDTDGLVSNFWRSVQADPGAVAANMRQVVTHFDVIAWRRYLLTQADGLGQRLLADIRYRDVELAGRWAWVVSSSIDWCTTSATRPAWRYAGCLGQADAEEWCAALAARLMRVMVHACPWSDLVGPSMLGYQPDRVLGVFLDPPYSNGARVPGLYRHDDGDVTRDVALWCRSHGHLRVALAGLEGEYDLPGWDCVAWKRPRGMESDDSLRSTERLWFSPACLPARNSGQQQLFQEEACPLA